MIADNPPVVPVVALPAGDVLPAEPPYAANVVQPVTAAEVAALARRIRVEAKVGRIAVIGTTLGVVCGTAAVWPFLGGGEYMAESLSTGGDMAAWGFLPSWLLVGLLPLLAFYAGRLHFESGQATTEQLEACLRKLRRIILGCMFASMASFVSVVAHRHSDYHLQLEDASWVMFIYAGCFVACGFIVGDVRRGLGDFDSEQQRRRRRLARGFTVELRAAETPAPGDAPADDDVPLAALAAPHAMPPVAALPILADAGEDDHARDLRLLMTLAIAIALGVHAVRLGTELTNVLQMSEGVVSNFPGSLWPGSSSSPMGPLALLLLLLAMIATILLAPCAVLWIVWGILSLNYGPTWRRTIGWLTAVTLALAVVCVLPGWISGLRDIDFGRGRLLIGMLSRAPEMVSALLVGLLLTRPGVKRLFARSSQLDDSN